MAKNKSTVTASEATEAEDSESTLSNSTERSEAFTFGPTEGGNNIFAAWQGLYNLFDAQVEWDVVPEGVVARNFTVSADYDPNEIVKDISGRKRDMNLVPGYFYLQGQAPAPFATSLEITKWMQQYFRTPGEDGKSPDYVKQANAIYKKNHDFPARKGRPRKIFRVETIGSINPESLVGVPVDELDKLLETVAAEKSRRSAAVAAS